MLKWFTKRKLKPLDSDTKKKLEDGYRTLKDSRKCKSLLKQHLTESTFDKLRKLKTDYGSTLWDVIQSGVENLDSGIGVFAPDPDAYTVYADLFDPIIQEYHDGFSKTENHPAKDFGNPQLIGNVDIGGDYVISTRIRCGRNVEGLPFTPCLSEAQYAEIEGDARFVLKKLKGEYAGSYYPLAGMKRATQLKLMENHFLFKEGDRFLQAAGACRFWPTGRGLFHNHDRTFLVWINEEDHFRIISMQMGGDLGSVYRRLVGGVTSIGSRYNFSRSEHLGYLTFCPTNLGTTIRASVHIKLPKLGANPASMEKVAEKYNFQIREKELPNHNGTVFDISNKRRLGVTEFGIVKELHDGVIELIKLERSM